jgi:hypothetical protein
MVDPGSPPMRVLIHYGQALGLRPDVRVVDRAALAAHVAAPGLASASR